LEHIATTPTRTKDLNCNSLGFYISLCNDWFNSRWI